ncbi:hypothetical protein SDC9_136412 [bioreactor metagenome]|uniref:Uncharacterized protein n=1 Tax=bioreactor metagenome TaxID=1076179 RepID=A0A645DKF3_9ZZZZ
MRTGIDRKVARGNLFQHSLPRKKPRVAHASRAARRPLNPRTDFVLYAADIDEPPARIIQPRKRLRELDRPLLLIQLARKNQDPCTSGNIQTRANLSPQGCFTVVGQALQLRTKPEWFQFLLGEAELFHRISPARRGYIKNNGIPLLHLSPPEAIDDTKI